MTVDNTSVLTWFSRLHHHLNDFTESPCEETKVALLNILKQYQVAVANGLKIPKNIPAPLPEAQTYSAWYHRLLDESLAMFRINPNDNRYDQLALHAQGYLEEFNKRSLANSKALRKQTPTVFHCKPIRPAVPYPRNYYFAKQGSRSVR